MDMNMEDEFGGETLTPEALKQISELANRQLRLQRDIDARNAELKVKTEELREVQEILLPNAMAEVNLSMFALDTGETVEIKKEIYCSVPKEGFPACETWLRDRGHEGLIKHKIEMMFGKGEDAEAEKAAKILLENGFEPTDSKTIHPQTLKAFIKEQLAEGVDIPLATFGAYEATKAKISLPKSK